MKLLVTLAMILFVSATLADGKNAEKTLENKKEKLLAHLDKKISKLQKSKECIEQAKDEKSLSECNKGESRREKLRKKMEGKKKPAI